MMRLRVGLGVVAFAIAGGVPGGPMCRVSAAEAEPARPRVERASMPLPLKVVGTHVVDSRGERVRLRGVNAACLEWASDGEGHILDTVKTAIDVWHVNHVRLPLAQDRWFGKAPEQKDGGIGYQALVGNVVDFCAGRGCYVVLDLHW
jgi:hypothetical protein